MRYLALLLAAATLALGGTAIAGCGNSKKTVTETGPNGQTTTRQVPKIHFATTKFVIHLGLAAGAFHRYIYKPFRSKAFSKGASGRKLAIVKAGAAALFVYHELKVARDDALASDKLRPLGDKLTSLTGSLKGLASSLKGGALNPAAILGANGALGGILSQSKGLGQVVKEHAPSL